MKYRTISKLCFSFHLVYSFCCCLFELIRFFCSFRRIRAVERTTRLYGIKIFYRLVGCFFFSRPGVLRFDEHWKRFLRSVSFYEAKTRSEVVFFSRRWKACAERWRCFAYYTFRSVLYYEAYKIRGLIVTNIRGTLSRESLERKEFSARWLNRRRWFFGEGLNDEARDELFAASLLS